MGVIGPLSVCTTCLKVTQNFSPECCKNAVMSNFPSCLQTARPSTSFVLQGDELTPAQVGLLRTQLRSLHFHPIIVVLPKHYKVKNGDAMVDEVAKTWGLGPHGMLIIYAPSDKSVHVACGEFNTKAGVDVEFFKRDFAQRMPAEAQEEHLYSALNATLQDIDRIIVRSDAYTKHGADSQTAQPTKPAGSHRHMLPGNSVIFTILVVVLFAASMQRRRNVDRRRMRFDDRPSTGLSADLERIGRLTGNGEGGGRMRSAVDQVPMAEFKKRATAGGVARKTHDKLNAVTGAGKFDADSAADFQAAIDSSAAKIRLDAKEQALSQATLSFDDTPNEEPLPEADSETYAASFGTDEAVIAPMSASRNEDAAFAAVTPAKLQNFSFPSAQSGISPDAPFPVEVQSSALVDAGSMLSINKRIPDNEIDAPNTVPAALETVAAISSLPGELLGTTSDQLASLSGAADQFNSSFASQLFSTVSTPTAAVAGLTSARSNETSAIVCPKCGEPKSKDFSFCIKCGHTY